MCGMTQLHVRHDSHTCVTWLPSSFSGVCVPQIPVWHGSCIRVTKWVAWLSHIKWFSWCTYAHVWRVCAKWPTHMCVVYVQSNRHICVSCMCKVTHTYVYAQVCCVCGTWPTHMCDVTNTCLYAQVCCVCGTWPTHMCDVTNTCAYAQVCRVCATWPTHMCDVTYLWRDSYIRVPWRVTWLTCDVIHTYVCSDVQHVAHRCVTWLLAHVWHDSQFDTSPHSHRMEGLQTRRTESERERKRKKEREGEGGKREKQRERERERGRKVTRILNIAACKSKHCITHCNTYCNTHFNTQERWLAF